MRRAPDVVGRRPVPYGIVERRVHQNHVGAVGAKTNTCEGLSPTRDIKDADLRRDAVELRVTARQAGKGFVTLDQHDLNSSTRIATARPAAPTPAPKSTTRSPGRAGVAAASSIAS